MDNVLALFSGSTLAQSFAAIVFGIISHVVFYKQGEHHMEAPKLFWLHIFALLALTYGKITTYGVQDGTGGALILFSSYLFGLFSSIAIYRRYLHRLRKFPGPPLAGITKLWHSVQCLSCKNHELLDKLHKKYGDVVRTGPSELTIFKPEVQWAVDGPLNNCTKAPWYDILLPLVALNTNRSKKEHDQRRRAWDQAVTRKNFDDYEERIREHVLLLEKHIADTAGEAINATQWFNFLAFDVMGEFSFAHSFGMLKSKQWHYAIVLLRKALTLLGPISSVPWLAQLAFSMPLIPIIMDWNKMLRWCTRRMDEQIMTHGENDAPNISSWLIGHSKKKGSVAKDKRMLKGDAVALIIAGSDTVSSTLAFLFYRLALHPDLADSVRAEIDELATVYDSSALKSLERLNGFIWEVLRLHPSVPTGGYRQTPAEGLNIAGTWIPGNITIVAPRYTIGRLETSYMNALDFVPKRWYSKPEMVTNKQQFNPFSLGRYSCLGKNLALSEIRFTTALLIKKYHIEFAAGDDGSSVLNEMKDQFTAVPGPLNLVFKPRA